jgi:hypothetical protein
LGKEEEKREEDAFFSFPSLLPLFWATHRGQFFIQTTSKDIQKREKKVIENIE